MDGHGEPRPTIEGRRRRDRGRVRLAADEHQPSAAVTTAGAPEKCERDFALTVLFSIVLYGFTARSALRLLDRRMGRDE